MNNIKTFFEKNNLNRGYGKHTQDKYFIKGSIKDQPNGLFPMELINRYEELSPGSFHKIVEMSTLEQVHRHEIKMRQQKALELSIKRSGYFAILVVCIISVTTVTLVLLGAEIVAAVFASFSFCASYLIFNLMYSKYSANIFDMRSPKRRLHNRDNPSISRGNSNGSRKEA